MKKPRVTDNQVKKREEEVMEAIVAFWKERKISPSMRWVERETGYSVSLVRRYVNGLVEAKRVIIANGAMYPSSLYVEIVAAVKAWENNS